jgi:hypothetical protein
MIRPAIAAALLLLAGCTTADIEVTSEEGILAKVHFTRFASSVGFSMSPEGVITYTSSPETQAANDLAASLLNLSRAVAGPVPGPARFDRATFPAMLEDIES